MLNSEALNATLSSLLWVPLSGLRVPSPRAATAATGQPLVHRQMSLKTCSLKTGTPTFDAGVAAQPAPTLASTIAPTLAAAPPFAATVAPAPTLAATPKELCERSSDGRSVHQWTEELSNQLSTSLLSPRASSLAEAADATATTNANATATTSGTALEVRGSELPPPPLASAAGSARTFVSANPIISRVLKARGWRACGTVAAADLVWAVRSSDIDWRRIRPQQLVNHFEAPCPLTTKLGLAFCLRGTGGAAVAESLRPQLLLDGVSTRATHWHFFPRVYDLSGAAEEMAAFTADVRLTAACSVLKRLVSHGFVPSLPLRASAQMSRGADEAARGAARGAEAMAEAMTAEAEAMAAEAMAEDEGGVHESLAAAAVRHIMQAARRFSQSARGGATLDLAALACGLDLRAFPPPTAADCVVLAVGKVSELSLYPLDTHANAHDGALAVAEADGQAAEAVALVAGAPECIVPDAAAAAATATAASSSVPKLLANVSDGWTAPPMARERLRALGAALLERLRPLHPQLDLDGTRNVWVIKPAFGSRGRGIEVLAGRQALRQAERVFGAPRVIQKYVERPLLLPYSELPDVEQPCAERPRLQGPLRSPRHSTQPLGRPLGRKFDIRLFVLRCGVTFEQCWLYDAMLLKVCAEPFCLGRLGERYRHITNCAVQRERLGARGGAGPTVQAATEAAAVSQAEEGEGGGEGCPSRTSNELLWSSERFRAHLVAQGYGERAWETRVLPAIRAVVAATFASRELTLNGLHAPSSSNLRPRSFECFGLDVILDDSLRPWLLEVNESPNLRDHGASLLEPMLSALLDVVLEPGGEGNSELGAWRRL